METIGMTATEILLENGYDDVVVFKDYSYDTALIGVTTHNQAVYDYEKMIEWLQKTEGWTYEDSAEWIDFNTLRSYPSYGTPPLVMYPLVK